jgi:hypothetical protein
MNGKTQQKMALSSLKAYKLDTIFMNYQCMTTTRVRKLVSITPELYLM